MSKKFRILYVAGPGKVIQTYHHWCHGEDDPSQVSMTFSGQFYNICVALDAEAYVIASHPETKYIQDGRFQIEHRPIPLWQRSTPLYFLGQVLYELGIIATAVRFRADVVVGTATDCFFVSGLLPTLGIQVIPSLHCVLWPKYRPLSKTQKILTKLNRRFFAKDCLAVLSTSQDINEQVAQIANGQPRPIVNFLSTYRLNEFADVAPPDRQQSTFQVFFAGRIEENKGVFDLLEIARRFQAEGRQNIIFNICGKGSMLEALQAKVKAYQLESTFVLHGYCNKPQMRQMFNLAHVVVVPTKSDFVEGLVTTQA